LIALPGVVTSQFGWLARLRPGRGLIAPDALADEIDVSGQAWVVEEVAGAVFHRKCFAGLSDTVDGVELTQDEFEAGLLGYGRAGLGFYAADQKDQGEGEQDSVLRRRR
jgi:hypothetical protein